ncbi:MAG: heme lyase CcmF/NrfE family subunit [Thiotrichales bacterium]
MIPELGHFAVVVAWILAMVQAVVPLIGAQRGHSALMAVARPAAQAQFVFAALGFAALAYAFLSNDFSVRNVARNSYSELPEIYRLTASWSSHEGSLLLWVLIAAGWGAAVATFGRGLPEVLRARVLAILGLTMVGFIALLLFTSNPFERLSPVPVDGRDMNPLLQDLGMILHPPMLYMGYVGFSVTFAFAIAALLGGRIDAAWAGYARGWATSAWSFLTVGVALGSWWAYYELGWGGWWFWDPTENASLMPWLAGTALIHSLAVTHQRGVFGNWSVFLAISAFSLSLVGTFLVRSGVLSSVHAFATDPARGTFILGLLALVVGGSLVLYAWRAPKRVAGATFTGLSRESLILGNNVLLMAALGTVMLGTLYPLLLDALGLGKVSVGPPYFNATFIPLLAPALFLLGIGPLTRWGRDAAPVLAQRLKWAFLVALVFAGGLPVVFGGSWMTSLGLFLATWIVWGVVLGFVARHRRERRFGGWLEQPRRFWGMQLAHLGVAGLVAGITLVSTYESDRAVRMDIGEYVDLNGYRLVFQGVEQRSGPNYLAGVGTFEVTSPRGAQFVLHPEKRKYNASGAIMTEAAIDYGLWRDVYVSLGDPLGGKAWAVHVYLKPFQGWLWMGAALLTLGGILAASDRRRRVMLRQPVVVDTPGMPGVAP